MPDDASRAVDILVVNAGEAEALGARVGIQACDPASLTKLLASMLGVTLVTTLGARGVLAVGQEAYWQVGALSVEPVGTTAAGDHSSGF